MDHHHDRTGDIVRAAKAALLTLAFMGAVFGSLLLVGCAISAGSAQVAFGSSDTLACGGKSKVTYGERVALECDGTLRWTTGGELSNNAVGAIGAARDAALRGAAVAAGVPVAR